MTRKPRMKMLLVVLLVGFMAAATVGFSYSTGHRMTAVYAPLVYAITEVALEVTIAHLWFEEILSGDRDEDMDKVWFHMDKADWYAKAVLDGGENAEGVYIPLNDETMREKVNVVRQNLAQFRGMTVERFTAFSTSGPGTALDRAYDQAYNQLTEDIEVVEHHLQNSMVRDLERFKNIEYTLVAFIFVVTLIIGWMYYRYEEARERNLNAINAANHDLEAALEERNRSNRKIKEIQNFLHNIINSMPSVMVGVDTEDRITHWNLEAVRFTGISGTAARGRPLAEVMPMIEEQMELVKTAHLEGVPQTLRRYAIFMESELRYFDIVIYPLLTEGSSGAVIRMDDVTDRIRIEDMMVQTEKMLSVGGLAAGMAHEINNPLGGILHGLQNIRRRLSPELPKNQLVAEDMDLDLDRVNAYLEKRQILQFLTSMRSAGERAAGIVANMLQFSRRPDSSKQPVNMAELLDQAVELAEIDYDLKKNYDFKKIEIRKEYDPGMPMVSCSPAEIEQVILNLLRNAAQAMHQYEGTKRPQIIIKTRIDGNFAVIEVIDNGPGMDDNTRSRVLEPFFTTKPPGLGTGLGLSVSFFIIKDAHQGHLSVVSAPDEGSRFSIRLPLGKAA